MDKLKAGAVRKVQTKGYDQSKEPFIINLTGTYEIEQINDMVIVKPLLDLPISENVLKQSRRTYPIDFIYPWNDGFKSTMEIPNGFSILSLPETFEVDDDLVNITLKYTENGGKLEVVGNYKFKKAVYTVAEYPRVKKYLDEIVKRFNASIMLEKLDGTVGQ